MKKIWLLIILFLCAFSISNAQELRFEVGADYSVKKLKFGIETQFRKSSLIDTDFLGLIEAEIFYKITNNFNIEIGYRFKTNVADFYPESYVDYNNKHRFTFDLGYNLLRFDNDIKLKNTIRYQINFSENGKQNNYLRNEFELNYKITKIFNPYLAPSIYYNLNKKEFSEFRIELGSDFEFGKNSVGVFYIVEIDILGTERTRYILGLSYGIGI
jgi:hypothetical protein